MRNQPSTAPPNRVRKTLEFPPALWGALETAYVDDQATLGRRRPFAPWFRDFLSDALNARKGGQS